MTKQTKLEFLEWLSKSPDWFRGIEDIENHGRGKLCCDDMFTLQRKGYIVFTKNGVMLTECGHRFVVNKKISFYKRIKQLLKKS